VGSISVSRHRPRPPPGPGLPLTPPASDAAAAAARVAASLSLSTAALRVAAAPQAASASSRAGSARHRSGSSAADAAAWAAAASGPAAAASEGAHSSATVTPHNAKARSKASRSVAGRAPPQGGAGGSAHGARGQGAAGTGVARGVAGAGLGAAVLRRSRRVGSRGVVAGRPREGGSRARVLPPSSCSAPLNHCPTSSPRGVRVVVARRRIRRRRRGRLVPRPQQRGREGGARQGEGDRRRDGGNGRRGGREPGGGCPVLPAEHPFAEISGGVSVCRWLCWAGQSASRPAALHLALLQGAKDRVFCRSVVDARHPACRVGRRRFSAPVVPLAAPFFPEAWRGSPRRIAAGVGRSPPGDVGRSRGLRRRLNRCGRSRRGLRLFKARKIAGGKAPPPP